MSELPQTNLRAQPPYGAALSAYTPSLQQATATMLDTVFRLTLAASEHAQKVVLPSVTAKLEELRCVQERENELRTLDAKLAGREKELTDRKKVIEEDKRKLDADRDAYKQQTDQKLWERYSESSHYLLPAALRHTDAREFVRILLPYLEISEPGWRLRAGLSAAALGEVNDKDIEPYLQAIQDLYPAALALDEEHKTQFVTELKNSLSSKNARVAIIIELPQPGARYVPAEMSGPPEVVLKGNIDRVKKWGVRIAGEGPDPRRKRAIVV